MHYCVTHWKICDKSFSFAMRAYNRQIIYSHRARSFFFLLSHSHSLLFYFFVSKPKKNAALHTHFPFSWFCFTCLHFSSVLLLMMILFSFHIFELYSKSMCTAFFVHSRSVNLYFRSIRLVYRIRVRWK